MKFLKDLLIVEIETTGEDFEKNSIIQLSAILLDKDNLLEKHIFNTYLRTSLLEGVLKEHAKTLGIPFEVMQKSSKIPEAIKKFTELSGSSPTLTLQTVKHLFFLKQMFKKAFVPFPFDLQIFQIWTLEYMFTRKLGLKKIPTLDTIINHYKLPVKNPHNALERARTEAEVLRRITKNS